MPSKVQIATAVARAKAKGRKRVVEASEKALIERLLAKVTLPTPVAGRDGRDAPELSDILNAITPLLPETKIEQTTIVEKLDKGEVTDIVQAMLDTKLPEMREEDKPAVEQIIKETTIDVSDEKLEGFVSKKDFDAALRRIQRAIQESSGGGRPPPEVGPIVNVIQADQATNVVLITDLDVTKINIVHASVANSTVTLPAISDSYIVWVEDAVVGGGNITITRA